MIRRFVRIAVVLAIAFTACGVLVTAVVSVLVMRGGLLDPALMARPDDGLRVVDRHGATLRQTRVDGVDRRWVPLAEISPRLVDAVVATEDAGFRSHHGVDVPAVFRAIGTDLLPWRRRSGASTITEQLVKLTYGRHGPIVWAKALEAARALSLERVMTKDEILEQYLNRLPFGDNVVGVARASEAYFGREPNELSLAQAALLAGIPQAPSANDPRRHAPHARARRDAVLARMLAVGAIDRVAYAQATAEPIELIDRPVHPYEAPRFVDRVMRDVGAHRIGPDRDVVATTLDLDLQRDAESVVHAALSQFDVRGAHNAAAIVVANATGEVLAYVGAADEHTDRGGALDLLNARRAPGSTLKPFVYELWFERGGTAATVLDDLPAPMTGARGESFDAHDYDGRFRGPVRARTALASSLNLPALDVARRVGPDRIVERLRSLGIAVPGDGSDYGGAIVLGGLSITPWQLTEAYVALSRGGTHVPLAVVPAASIHTAPVMRASAALLTRDILEDASARREGFGDDLRALAPGEPFALKTGTSSGWRDAWTAVFDDRLTVLVWLGDPVGVPMRGVSGFQAAAPAAVRILAAARRRADADDVVRLATPNAPLVEVSVCAHSGLRAGPHCTHVLAERFVPGSVPAAVCDAHDASGHDVLAPRYASWVAHAHPSNVAVDTNAPAATGERLEIRSPSDGARLAVDRTRGDTVIPLRATLSDRGAVPAQWLVDGNPVSDGRWVARPGHHSIAARWNGLRSREVQVEVIAVGALRAAR